VAGRGGMKVIICGAGQVGFGIAERLAAEDNDVSVIDNAPHLIQTISDTLNVRGFVGHGSHPDVLARAGAEDADMIIAVTLYDEVNMVASQVAHSLFSIPTKVARIRAQSYLKEHWLDLFSRDHMPIDVIISPEVEVGEMVLRRLALPGAFDVVSFAEGEIAVVGVVCEEDCPVVDTPLSQLTELFPDLAAVVVAVKRGNKLFVPHSNDQMLVGDEIYFIAAKDQVERTLSLFGHEERQASRVVLVGGGNIGFFVASQLEMRGSRARAKVVEMSRERAIEIADKLSRTVVLNGSALDEAILREADIEHAETMVALTNDDQVNMLSSVMARKLGCPRVLPLINNTRYSSIVRSLGIDGYINPRAVTVSKILQHVRRGRIRGVHSVFNGEGEVIEAEALETSPLVGKPLRDLNLDEGLRIGSIYRDGEVVIPRGDTQIQAHDRIVIFAMAEEVRKVEQMFRVSLEFF
jgi:trk system potassium uptake protein TrkA